jgi:hypothetical protein
VLSIGHDAINTFLCHFLHVYISNDQSIIHCIYRKAAK